MFYFYKNVILIVRELCTHFVQAIYQCMRTMYENNISMYENNSFNKNNVIIDIILWTTMYENSMFIL